ncbi:Diuretic hormone receptor [Taenia crassiceps]|uniref:Diuretic hormone receptor n=1 Tax=Taenia crassiceps TaxID=6207 RepID=A0ABR4Q8N8_9CEST
MRSVVVLYILIILFFTTTLLLLCWRGPTSNLEEVGDYIDFEDPLIVSLIKATSYPVHLPLHLELLWHLSLSDGVKFVQVHEEIVSWHRSPLNPLVPFSSYSGCSCGHIDEPCRCSIQLVQSPIPPFKSLDPEAYHPLITFKSCYAIFNFNITFIPALRIAKVSGFIERSMKKPEPGMWDERIDVFQGFNVFLPSVERCFISLRGEIPPSWIGSVKGGLLAAIMLWIIGVDQNLAEYLYNATTSVQAWASLAMLCWMFVEGVYLLNIVYWTFRLHQVRIWQYALFGWGVPAIFISIWTTIHAVTHPNIRWIEQSQDFYLISLPSLIILSSNALVLISIIYALIFRLKVPKNSSPSFPSHDLEAAKARDGKPSWPCVRHRPSSYRSCFRISARFNRSESVKSLKACLTLIPLLGIPQVIFIVPYHSSVVQIFTYVNAVVTSTQGFWVALIYCFLNEEVRLLLRSTLQKVLLRKHLRRHWQSCQTSGRPRQRSTLDLTGKFVVASGKGASSTISDI